MTHRNNDIENTPAVVVAEPAEETDTGAGGKMGGGLRTYPICYSPCYYYFRVVICIIALVVAIMSWITYTKQCSEWSGAMLPEAWPFEVAPIHFSSLFWFTPLHVELFFSQQLVSKTKKIALLSRVSSPFCLRHYTSLSRTNAKRAHTLNLFSHKLRYL